VGGLTPHACLSGRGGFAVNVLVVGGCGYVGGAIVDVLSRSEHQVRVYDALLYEECYRKPIDFVFGDVRDRDRLCPQLEWADAVIWLAALVGDGACALNPEVTVAINQDAVEWLARVYDGRILFMSTCSVYGAQDGLLDESAPVEPLSLYAQTKLTAEGFLEDKNALTFRLGTLFGVGDTFSRLRLDLVVNTLTMRAHRHGTLTVFGGDQFRPLLHVRDVAYVAVDNLATSVTGIFNLHESNLRIIDVAYTVREHFPQVLIEQKPMPPTDTRNYRVSSEEARRRLGFRPLYSLDDGILELQELLAAGRVRDLDNPRYRNEAFLSTSQAHTLVAGEKGPSRMEPTPSHAPDRSVAA
jgi:nucleoside-diphosphate-sugar epimerase